MQYSDGAQASTFRVIFSEGETLQWTVTDGDLSGGGGVSQEILDLEEDAHDLVNAERTSLSYDALTMREDLRLVARAHSQDMIDRDFFDHTNPDGDDPFDRMADAGITYTTAGENIAMNSGYADPAAAAVDGWMDSTGHRNNILRAAFTHAGMGVATDGNGKYMFTQVFTGGSKQILIKTWAVEAAAAF